MGRRRERSSSHGNAPKADTKCPQPETKRPLPARAGEESPRPRVHPRQGPRWRARRAASLGPGPPPGDPRRAASPASRLALHAALECSPCEHVLPSPGASGPPRLRRRGSRQDAPAFPRRLANPRRNADCASAGSVPTSRLPPPRPSHGDQTKELLQTFLSQHTRLASMGALSPPNLSSTE